MGKNTEQQKSKVEMETQKKFKYIKEKGEEKIRTQNNRKEK